MTEFRKNWSCGGLSLYLLHKLLCLLLFFLMLSGCGLNIGGQGLEADSRKPTSSENITIDGENDDQGRLIVNFVGLKADKTSLELLDTQGDKIGTVELKKAIFSARNINFYSNIGELSVETVAEPILVYDLVNKSKMAGENAWNLPVGNYFLLEIGINSSEEVGVNQYLIALDIEVKFDAGQVIAIELQEPAHILSKILLDPVPSVSLGSEVFLDIFVDPSDWFNFNGSSQAVLDPTLQAIQNNDLDQAKIEFAEVVKPLLPSFFKSMSGGRANR